MIACMHAVSLSSKYVARGRRRFCKKVLVEISKNGSRPQRENRICYDISQRTLRQAIATPGEHSQGRSRVSGPVCPLHTAITHVIKVLELGSSHEFQLQLACETPQFQ